MLRYFFVAIARLSFHNLQITNFCFNIDFLERLAELCVTNNRSYTYIIQQQQKKVCKTAQPVKSLLTLWKHTIYAESVSLFSNCERRKFDKWRRVGGHLPASYHLVWRGAVAYLCHKVILRPAIIK